MEKQKAKLQLRKLVKELSSYRARHTELISVYVPSGYNLDLIVNQLHSEAGTARNIKSASTRKNVIAALEKMVGQIRIYKKTPANGLALFSGNVSERAGQIDVKIWAIEPAEPLKLKMYKCDQRFYLEPLKEQMSVKVSYGLLVMDTREANLAVLKGKIIVPVKGLKSAVPGKIRAGGQCLAVDTLIQMSDGRIVTINDVQSDIKCVNFDKFEIKDTQTIDKWKIRKKESYKIITKNPRNEVICSSDHLFFVRDKNKIIQKPASELNTGDHLVMPEKIKFKGEPQKINATKYNKSHTNIKIPNDINEEFAQIIGYYLGDGSLDDSRIAFSEQRKELAEYYHKKIASFFNAKSSIRFRENKGYYQLRINGRPIENLFRNEFPKKIGVPEKILKSPNNIVATFLKGFFDAEGYIASRVGLGINDKLLAKQIQLLLLRFGILSSLQEYDNRRNPYSDNLRYTIEVCGKDSHVIFKDKIGFSAKDKQDKLARVIENKSDTDYTRQILFSGSEIRKIIEAHGYKLHQKFKQIAPGGFFVDKREMSKAIFKRQILDKINKNSKLYKELKKVYKYSVIPVKINKIELVKQPIELIDISTKAENFIANGLVVHNSAARFARVREGMVKDFYKKIGSAVNNEFKAKEIVGVLVGGPGPTKEDFINGDFLSNEIKKKIIATKHLGYTGEFGLNELVEKSQDVLAKEEVVLEKQAMDKFLTLLNTKPTMVAYGAREIEKAISAKAVELLLISEEVAEEKAEALMERVEKAGGETIMISNKTREGQQLVGLGKLAAILRYSIS